MRQDPKLLKEANRADAEWLEIIQTPRPEGTIVHRLRPKGNAVRREKKETDRAIQEKELPSPKRVRPPLPERFVSRPELRAA